MKDLMLKYKNKNGNCIEKSYDTIMDFIDEMESDAIEKPMMEDAVKSYLFFEKPMNRGSFATVADILAYCKRIIK